MNINVDAWLFKISLILHFELFCLLFHVICVIFIIIGIDGVEIVIGGGEFINFLVDEPLDAFDDVDH